MKTLLLGGVALLAMAGIATAQPLLNGEISVNGDDVFTITPAAITFSGLGNVGGTSGSFSELPNCFDCVTMIAELTASSTGQLFSATSGGHTSTFTIEAGTLSATASTNPNPALDAIEVIGDGTITLDGVSQPSSFVLTSQGPTSENVTFSATATTAAVPAPPIGQTVPAILATLMVLGFYRFRRG